MSTQAKKKITSTTINNRKLKVASQSPKLSQTNRKNIKVKKISPVKKAVVQKPVVDSEKVET